MSSWEALGPRRLVASANYESLLSGARTKRTHVRYGGGLPMLWHGKVGQEMARYATTCIIGRTL